MIDNNQSLNDGNPNGAVNPSTGSPFGGLSQEEVDKKIGNIRVESRNQGWNAGYEQAKRELTSQNQAPTAPVSPSQPASGLTAEEVKHFVKEGISEYNGRKAWDGSVNDFLTQMQPGYAKYNDFEQKVGSLNLAAELPEIIGLVRGLPNAHDVMYELANNPDKAILLADAVRGRRSSSAHLAVKKLSDELLGSDKVKQQGFPPDPLSKVNQSSMAGSDGRSRVKDLRSNPLLKR